MSVLGAVVIGAGQAGLATSWHLTKRGIDHLVVERGRVGETWRSQRWDSFALNTPAWYSVMPGEEAADDPGAFWSAPTFVDRMAAFAARNGAPILTNATVTNVRTSDDGRQPGEFTVSITRGHWAAEATTTAEASTTTDPAPVPEEIRTRNVIVASGILNVPRVPALGREIPAGIAQFTAATYRRPTDLPNGAVLVVGSGQSGVQIAEELAQAGRTVHLAVSSVGRLPRRYRGRDMFEWLVEDGFFDQTPDRLPDPAMQKWAQPQTSGVGPRGHSVSLQYLAGLGVHLVGRPVEVDGDGLRLDDTVAAAIAFGDRVSAELRARVDNAITAAGLELPALEPDPADIPHPDPGTVHSPELLDLDRQGIGTVVWTTGFGGDFAYLPDEVVDPTGAPIHVDGVTPVPGLLCIGFPWLRSRRSGIIGGVDGDAARLVGLVAGRLAHGGT